MIITSAAGINVPRFRRIWTSMLVDSDDYTKPTSIIMAEMEIAYLPTIGRYAYHLYLSVVIDEHSTQ